MRTKMLVVGGMMLMVGCVGTDVEPPAGEPFELPELGAHSDTAADAAQPLHVVPLSRPLASGCAAQPLIGDIQTGNSEVGNPVITETLGADGCIDERWVRSWDGDRQLTEAFEFWDPDLANYVYVQPYNYEHVWSYDARGRVVREVREPTDDAEGWAFLETKTYDEGGRLIEHVRRNDAMIGPPWESSSREVWTFGASTDFETHAVIYNDELSETTRRVFDAEGRIVEEWMAHRDQPEHLVLRNAYDDAGRLIGFESWDRYTATPGERVHIERRSDGTVSRRVEKNLQLGWLNVYEYDEAEREVLYTQDETEDGDIEYRRVKRYDEAGNTVFESTEYGFDDPQPRRSQTTRRFDEQGRLIEGVSRDPWMHGEARRERYEYDSTGSGYVATREVLDAAGDLVRVEVRSRFLTPDQLSWRRSDSDADGVLESDERYRWDGERPLEVLRDWDGDGLVDSLEQWHYDAVGQLVAHLVDADADGVVDHQTLNAY